MFCKLTNGGQSRDTATGIALNLGVVCAQLHNERSQCTRLHNSSLVLSYTNIQAYTLYKKYLCMDGRVSECVCVCVCVCVPGPCSARLLKASEDAFWTSASDERRR